MGTSRQVFLLLGVLVALTVAEENVTKVEARSDTVAESPFVHEIASRTPMDKVGVDGPSNNNNNNNNGGVYMAGKPYINYQAASADEDDEYNQALQAAGVRSSNVEPGRAFNNVPMPQNAFPYVTNFNPYGTSAVVSGMYQGQASNNNPYVNQESVQKSMDNNKAVGGYTDQQFDGNVNQASFKADSLQQSQNFVDSNNNDFVNFNGQQAAFQTPNNNNFVVSQQQQNQQQQQQQNRDFNNQQQQASNQNFNSANTVSNNNGQKLTGTKMVSSPQLAYLMMPGGMGGFPQLLNGGNAFGQMPFQGNMFANNFMPPMMMAPQMGGNGFNMNQALKQAFAKQQMQNPGMSVNPMTRNMMAGQMPMAGQASQMNFNGMLSPNTLSMPMFYGNMGNMANKLSMPYPGAFSPMIYPGQMFMPAMGGFNNPFFQRNRGKGSTSSKNKAKSENRDDRDDLEDLFEDDPVDQDSSE